MGYWIGIREPFGCWKTIWLPNELPETFGCGLSIGNGHVEGTCKKLIRARLKQTGTK